MSNRSGLTNKVAKALPIPESGYRIAWDTKVTGLGLRITAGGARSFILNYRTKHGTERRYTIGPLERWSVEAARDEANRLLRIVDAGGDPQYERREARATPTIADLCDEYLRREAEIHKRASSVREDRGLIDKVIKPELGRLKLAEANRDHIEGLHRQMKGTPVRANRTHSLIRRMFNTARDWPDWRKYVQVNPAVGLKHYHEEKRTRYLSPSEELPRLAAALAAYEGSGRTRDDGSDGAERQQRKTVARLIRFLLLTGCRRGEAFAATWGQFDLSAGTWTKPSAATKQKREHRLPLSAPVVQLLQEMRPANAKPTDNVFPGVDGKPIADIKRAWLSICRRAGMAVEVEKVDKAGKPVRTKDGRTIKVWQPTARVHDLRHTHASILASAGMSLPMIGALLGHSQPTTTQRYAHLFDDPLRQGVERVGELVTAAAAGNAAEVVPLKTGRI